LGKQEIDYEGFCTNVKNLNEKIRFAAVLDLTGKRIGGGYSENVSSHLSLAEVKQSMQYAIKRWENRDRLSHRIGHPRYSLTEYEKVKQITIPIGKNHILLLSTEVTVDHVKLLEKICSLIDQYFRGFLLKQYSSSLEIKKINENAIRATKKDKGHVKKLSE